MVTLAWPRSPPCMCYHPGPCQEKLKYFPVCVNTKPEPEDEAEEGLGGLPSNISSVSSLLLFNTTENLYGTRQGPGRAAGWPGLASWGPGGHQTLVRKSAGCAARSQAA